MKEIINTNIAQPNPGRRQKRLFSFAFLHIFRRSIIMSPNGVCAFLLVFVVLLATGPLRLVAQQVAQSVPQPNDPSAQESPQELQQLVAPIALYPDALVAQILAASTYPTQIVEAERWLEKHSKLKDDKLADEVNKESWDPSVKGLTQFPDVLNNMNTNLSWTSALGDAYYNQQQDVLSAIQDLRQRAQDAGTLKSTPQQTVATQGQTIVIQPAQPEVVYVPTYDPWVVYGAPLPVYPGYFFDDTLGAYPYLSYGPGIGLGFGFGGFGWGWNAWGFDWRRHDIVFNHSPFISRSHDFSHRFSGPGGRENFGAGRIGPSGRGNSDFGGRGDSRSNHEIGQSPSGRIPNSSNDSNQRALRGFGQQNPGTTGRSGAFSGFGQGGIERGFSSRGQSSFGGGRGFGGGGVGGGHGFGGGGGMRGGGGGMRGGGGGGRH
jgi:hypothetical protein